jgi:SNF2 family DNA or RNA helicase
MLDTVEPVLRNNGFNLQRIDGQTELPQRRRAFEIFRADDSCTVLLASIGSIGEG